MSTTEPERPGVYFVQFRYANASEWRIWSGHYTREEAEIAEKQAIEFSLRYHPDVDAFRVVNPEIRDAW
jgi:hypothetical protein